MRRRAALTAALATSVLAVGACQTIADIERKAPPPVDASTDEGGLDADPGGDAAVDEDATEAPDAGEDSAAEG